MLLLAVDKRVSQTALPLGFGKDARRQIWLKPKARTFLMEADNTTGLLLLNSQITFPLLLADNFLTLFFCLLCTLWNGWNSLYQTNTPNGTLACAYPKSFFEKGWTVSTQSVWIHLWIPSCGSNDPLLTTAVFRWLSPDRHGGHWAR